MLLGILSDTHDQLARTQAAVEILRAAGAEALVHCGDLIETPIIEACSVLPCYFVFGNNDCDNVSFLKQAAADSGAVCLGWGGVFELGGKRIGVVHGHLTSDVRRVLNDRPDYLLSGHSHLADDRRQGSVRWINPGALHRAREFSVALLDLETDSLQFLPVPR
ncbi:MAG: metallophosphoesterase [Planctomycetaceae bacterium]|nr:metallophosphoesterase [Planctomycetaceae bacterium]